MTIWQIANSKFSDPYEKNERSEQLLCDIINKKENFCMLLPAISFQGNCENAIKFYQEALDAQIKSIVYANEAPVDSGLDPNMPDDFIMDSEIIIDGQRIMMTDGRLNRPANDFFSFCLVKESADEVTTIFNSLSIDGKVIDPLAPVFWSSLYGMVEDQYGITWMIMTTH